jgi:hypothetical protein
MKFARGSRNRNIRDCVAIYEQVLNYIVIVIDTVREEKVNETTELDRVL